MDEQAKRLMQYAAEIKDYCKAHEHCNGCPFELIGNMRPPCALDYGLPVGWALDYAKGKEAQE